MLLVAEAVPPIILDSECNARHILRQITKPVRVGVVGVGSRGTGLLRILLSMKDVQVPALCDINVQHLNRAQDLVVKAGQEKPEGYSEAVKKSNFRMRSPETGIR